MMDIVLALIIHFIAASLWVAGVGMLVYKLLPEIRNSTPPWKRLAAFYAIETRFAWPARAVVIASGVTGFFLMFRMDMWSRAHDDGMWWMHTMIFTWCLVFSMIYVIEPVWLNKYLDSRAQTDAEGAFRLVEMVHRTLAGLSVLSILGALAGSAGLLGR